MHGQVHDERFRSGPIDLQVRQGSPGRAFDARSSFRRIRSHIMRRFIILSAMGLGLCFGGSTMAQAAVVKTVTKKVVVEKTVVTEHAAPVRFEHFATAHWSRSFHRFHR
jgi:GMP synthase-like glutamine amidotransferase